MSNVYYDRFAIFRPIESTKDFFRRRKWARQRSKRGFCDRDIWDADVICKLNEMRQI